MLLRNFMFSYHDTAPCTWKLLHAILSITAYWWEVVVVNVFINWTSLSTWLSCFCCSWCSLLWLVHVLHWAQSSRTMYCGLAGREHPMNSSIRCSWSSRAVDLTTALSTCQPMTQRTWVIRRVKRYRTMNALQLCRQQFSHKATL